MYLFFSGIVLHSYFILYQIEFCKNRNKNFVLFTKVIHFISLVLILLLKFRIEHKMHKIKTIRLDSLYDGIFTGVGAFVGLSLIGLIAQSVHQMLLIAPFGATAVLLFSAPESQFSKPWNVLVSYVISTLIGFLILHFSSGDWLSIGIGFGIVITLMHTFKAIHPPAGANFLIVTQGHLTLLLLWPLFAGLITLIIIGMGLHKLRKNIYN